MNYFEFLKYIAKEAHLNNSSNQYNTHRNTYLHSLPITLMNIFPGNPPGRSSVSFT